MYRLTSETITEGEKVTTYTYAYDNVSNRILKTENGRETEYVYNSLNQLVSDSETTYEYDRNGNLIRVIGTANSALYEYNCENKLVKATVQNGVLVIEESYTYDYSGNRTSKTTRRSDGNTEYVKYLNDNSSLTNVLAEIDETGTAKCVYTIGADLISQERDGKVSVYIYDGHGSVVGLAAMSGNVTDTYKYDAFGNLIKSTGSTANNYRYCGEQFDETTGLYYLRARYMDTSTGRFISQDSYSGSISDPVSLHKYLYANSNPVMYSDPSGYASDFISVNTTLVGVAILASGLIVAQYTGLFKSHVEGLVFVAETIDRVQIKISEVMIDIFLGISVCISFCQRVMDEAAKKAFPGNLNICFSMLFGFVAAHVYLQMLRKGNKYGNDTEEHHIVAQSDPRAISSRIKLHLVKIGINDPINLVSIKKAVHKFLHTTEYFMWVNEEINDAFYSSIILTWNMAACKSSIKLRLGYMKNMILALNSMF